jgi:hypothetical protein
MNYDYALLLITCIATLAWLSSGLSVLNIN